MFHELFYFYKKEFRLLWKVSRKNCSLEFKTTLIIKKAESLVRLFCWEED